jgi:hypothetical protein
MQNKQNIKPKTGNRANVVLAVALLFRVKKLKNYQKTVCGFGNRFFRIIRNTKNDYYFYGFYDFVFEEYRTLHKGIKLPITGLQITIWCIIFNLLLIPFRLITFLPLSYFDGARNFIRDTAWYQNVRFFNWMNFIALIILICVTLFKSYC